MSRDKSTEKEFLRQVEKISKKLTYPIADKAALLKAVGGDKAAVEWRGQKHRAGQAVEVVPDYFFPIESDDDFATKAANLELLRPGSDLAPDMADEEPASPARKRPEAAVGKPPKQIKRQQGGPALVVGERG